MAGVVAMKLTYLLRRQLNEMRVAPYRMNALKAALGRIEAGAPAWRLVPIGGVSYS